MQWWIELALITIIYIYRDKRALEWTETLLLALSLTSNFCLCNSFWTGNLAIEWSLIRVNSLSAPLYSILPFSFYCYCSILRTDYAPYPSFYIKTETSGLTLATTSKSPNNALIIFCISSCPVCNPKVVVYLSLILLNILIHHGSRFGFANQKKTI